MTVHYCLRCSFTAPRPGILQDHIKATHNLTAHEVEVDMGRSFALIAGSAFFNSMQKIPSLVAAAQRLAEATSTADGDSTLLGSGPSDSPTSAVGTANKVHDLTTPSPTDDVQPLPTRSRAPAPAVTDPFTLNDDVPHTPVDAPKPLARLASVALTPEAVRITRRVSAPALSPIVFTPESAPSYSSPTLATVAGTASRAVVATGFVMGPRPGDANPTKMRVLNNNPALIRVDADPLVTAVWRAEGDLSQPDPRSQVSYQLAILRTLDATQREFWQNIHPVACIRNLCVACYVARVPCIGHTAFDSCPRPLHENIMTVTVPHGGEWKTYLQISGGYQPTSAAKPHCFKCWFLLRGLHREDIKRDSQCKLHDILQPLLFLFWVQHSALIKSGFFGTRQPQTFDEYWVQLRAPEDGISGYPIFVRYVISIVQFLGVTQLPLPPPPSA